MSEKMPTRTPPTFQGLWNMIGRSIGSIHIENGHDTVRVTLPTWVREALKAEIAFRAARDYPFLFEHDAVWIPDEYIEARFSDPHVAINIVWAKSQNDGAEGGIAQVYATSAREAQDRKHVAVLDTIVLLEPNLQPSK